jgi:hypothetical protein
LREQRFGGFAVRNIGLRSEGSATFSAHFIRYGFGGRYISADRHGHVGAGLGQRERYGSTNASASTGY